MGLTCRSCRQSDPTVSFAGAACDGCIKRWNAALVCRMAKETVVINVKDDVPWRRYIGHRKGAVRRFQGTGPGVIDMIDVTPKFANPFPLKPGRRPGSNLPKYKAWLRWKIREGKPPYDLESLADLSGKVLACHCKPEPCHGDILALAADWAARRLASRG